MADVRVQERELTTGIVLVIDAEQHGPAGAHGPGAIQRATRPCIEAFERKRQRAHRAQPGADVQVIVGKRGHDALAVAVHDLLVGGGGQARRDIDDRAATHAQIEALRLAANHDIADQERHRAIAVCSSRRSTLPSALRGRLSTRRIWSGTL